MIFFGFVSITLADMWSIATQRVVARRGFCVHTALTSGFPDLVTKLRSIADLPKEEMLGKAGDVFTEMLEQPGIESANSRDVVRLYTVCGKMRLFDSSVFERVNRNLDLTSFEDLKKLVTACNRLKYTMTDVDVFERAMTAHKSAIAGSDMRTLVAFMQYAARSGASGLAGPMLEGLSKKVAILKEDPELMKSRAVIGTDEAIKWITAAGQLKTKLTPEQKEDVKYVLTKILAYELRNVPFQSLMKLFFSLTELQVFDDFFVRRRLVPAIASSFRSLPQQSPKDTLLVLTAVSQLPFSNPLVVELTDVAKEVAAKLDPDHELAGAIEKVIKSIRT